MNVVPFHEPHRPAAAATAASPGKDEAKPPGVREPATAEEKHEEHVDEPGYGHGV